MKSMIEDKALKKAEAMASLKIIYQKNREAKASDYKKQKSK